MRLTEFWNRNLPKLAWSWLVSILQEITSNSYNYTRSSIYHNLSKINMLRKAKTFWTMVAKILQKFGWSGIEAIIYRTIYTICVGSLYFSRVKNHFFFQRLENSKWFQKWHICWKLTSHKNPQNAARNTSFWREKKTVF